MTGPKGRPLFSRALDGREKQELSVGHVHQLALEKSQRVSVWFRCESSPGCEQTPFNRYIVVPTCNPPARRPPRSLTKSQSSSLPHASSTHKLRSSHTLSHVQSSPRRSRSSQIPSQTCAIIRDPLSHSHLLHPTKAGIHTLTGTQVESVFLSDDVARKFNFKSRQRLVR